MIRHILLLFSRTLLRSRFQLVTVFSGLSIGIAVSLLIYIYVQEESGYDRHHADAHRIYRVNTILETEGNVDHTAKAGLNTGGALMDFYPEVEDYTQFLNISKQTITIGEDLYSSEEVVYAHANVFTFFTYPFVLGNQAEALGGPNMVVISEAVAVRYFGSAQAAFGATMKVNNKNYEITGVYAESGHHTHIPYRIFLSMSSLPKDFLDARNREYMWLTTYNYIKLKEGLSGKAFEERLEPFNEDQLVPYVAKNEVNGSITFQLEPVTGIHLNTTLRFDFSGAIKPFYLRLFSAVAMLTLFIALINYVNITTASVSKRTREIGIKKAIGASRKALWMQFTAESVLVVFASYLSALMLLGLFLPELNKLTGKSLELAAVLDAAFLLRSLAFILLFGLLAGIYPATVLSALPPVNALKATTKTIAKSLLEKIASPGFIRRFLVTLQFGISVFLIIGTIVIYRQFDFLRRQDLGFDQEQVLVIDIPNDTAVSNHLEVVKTQLQNIPAVQAVSAASSVPGTWHAAPTMNVSQTGGSEIKVVNAYFVDEDFRQALGLELKAGRFFSKDYPADPQQSFVINEAAARLLGWDEPLEKKIESPFGQKGQVIGVVKDFNYKSLHTSIEPLILMNTPTSQGYLMVKLATDELENTLTVIGSTWKAFDGAHPYEYFFLDDQFQAQYLKEQRLTRIFTWFSTVTILISCLGLVGLAVFVTEVKIKEIGIRKTFGASRLEIFRLLSFNFVWQIVLANALAWPLAYVILQNWLDGFAYRAGIGLMPFAAGMLLSFLVSFATVAYFATKAARLNVVQALKYE